MRIGLTYVLVTGDIIGASSHGGKASCGFIFGPIGNRMRAQKNNRRASGGAANRRQAMGFKPSRRSVVAGIGAAAAATAAAPALAPIAAIAREEPGGLAYRTAGELVKALADRKISARELLAASISRIEALDPKINAVVVRDFDRARAAADAADAALARGERRPLLGLPMTVKEQVGVAGLPTTWGCPQFRDWKAEGDALPVRRLRAAGATRTGTT